MYEVFGFNSESPVRVLRWYLGLMPFEQRLPAWLKIQRAGGFDNAREAIRLLLPNWLVRRLSDRA